MSSGTRRKPLEKIVMDDVIVLGNAVPDFISNNRTSICTAGYSPTHGLIRIYPVPINSEMHRWNIVEVPLERNPADTRVESWKIQNSRTGWNRINSQIRLIGKVKEADRPHILKSITSSFGVDCVHELNQKKRSLGFVSPTVENYRFVERDDYQPPNQTLYGGTAFLTIKNYRYQPRIRYRCSNCESKRAHDQQSVEWGVYEWMRKNPNKKDEVWKILGLTGRSENPKFLIGNQKLHRTSFLVITVFH